MAISVSIPKIDTNKKNKVISTYGLHKYFYTEVGETQVLHGIDLDIEQGEFIIIFGPSGSGKSTLLHSIIGLEKPTKGRVTLFGKDIYLLSEDERSMNRLEKIGIMYQQPIWIKALDVLHNVAMPLYLLGYSHKEAMKIAKEKLQVYAMDRWAKYKPTELSSGQQQKISLIRALITEPKILIADEPTGNLDIDSSKRLIEGLKELNIVGTTVIVVTHDLQYLSFADRTFYIKDGKLAGVYTKDETKKIIDDVLNKGKSISKLDRKKK